MEMEDSQVGCFQITGRWSCYSIFLITHLQCFSRDFCQKVNEETNLFQLKFQKPISRCRILQKIKMLYFVKLKCRGPLKFKSWKICPFLGLFIPPISTALMWKYVQWIQVQCDYRCIKGTMSIVKQSYINELLICKAI